MLFDQEQEIQELKKTLASKEQELEKVSRKPEVSISQTYNSFSDSERAKLNGKIVSLLLARLF